MIKTIFLTCLINLAFTKEISTSTELAASPFCKEYQCAPSDVFKDSNGDSSITFRIKKDPLSYDLLAVLKDGKITKITLKFIADEAKAEKKVISQLVTSLLGKAPKDSDIEKLAMGADIKTTRAQFAASEKIAIDNLNVSVGKILRQPTLQFELK